MFCVTPRVDRGRMRPRAIMYDAATCPPPRTKSAESASSMTAEAQQHWHAAHSPALHIALPAWTARPIQQCRHARRLRALKELQQRLRHSLPPEPELDGGGSGGACSSTTTTATHSSPGLAGQTEGGRCVLVRVQMPDGSRHTRRWLESSGMQQVSPRWAGARLTLGALQLGWLKQGCVGRCSLCAVHRVRAGRIR